MDLKEKIEKIKIKNLLPYENNPKKHPEEQLKKIADSILEFGFTVPMIIDKNNRIIAGHGRYFAVKKYLDLKKVPCIKRDDLTKTQVKAFRIADNRITESSWDDELLSLELEELDELDFDLELTGFEDEEISGLLDEQKEIGEDDFEEPDEIDSRCEKEQVWKLGEHRVMCGDATSEEDVEKLMGGNKADMVMTSPPYWVGMEYEEEESFKEVKEFIQNSVNAFHSSVKEKGRIVINTGTARGTVLNEETQTFLLLDRWQDEFKEKGWLLRHVRIWSKKGGFPATVSPDIDMVNMQWEFIGTFYKPRKPFQGQNRTDSGWAQQGVWNDFKGEARQHEHCASYPIELPARNIKLYSDVNNSILDPFGGSGTTLIACEQLDRKCYMMEISEEYCEVIMQRWEELTGQKAELVE